jgi:V/A-type H+-transporting ATPase subunit E
MSIKNITDKILSDAREKQADILAKAKQGAEELVSGKVKEALASEEQTLSKAQEEAAARKNRIIQGAQLKMRNQKLSAKHEVIERTFDTAVERLGILNGEQFTAFLKNAVRGYKITGEGVLRVNAGRHLLITPEVLSELRSLTGVSLTLGKALEGNQDGFVVEQRGIQINCTFQSLVESLKEDLIFDVTKILFE